MPAIGITGGIATGKSTFRDCLSTALPGAKFFDADLSAREVADLPEAREELVREFGHKIFSDTGGLNRDVLRAIVFRDAAKKRALEQILHPRIRRQWSRLAEAHRNSSEFFFADIPLLYETDGQSLCDRVVVVACSHSIQLERLMKRKSMGEREAKEIINSQMPLEEKMRRADHVVWNNGERAALMEQGTKLIALWNSQSWTRMK